MDVDISTCVIVHSSSAIIPVTNAAKSSFHVPRDISAAKDNELVQPRIVFHKKAMFGKMRYFQTSRYEAFPFIEYSEENETVYCFCCRHFPSSVGRVEDSFT